MEKRKWTREDKVSKRGKHETEVRGSRKTSWSPRMGQGWRMWSIRKTNKNKQVKRKKYVWIEQRPGEREMSKKRKAEKVTKVIKGRAWCRLSRLRVNPDISPDEPKASTQALWAHFWPNLLPSLSILITEQLQEKRNGLIHNPRHCCTCPPAQSPDCTLLSCMSRLAPFFNSKRVASTLFTAAAQWRADFPEGKNIFISRQSKRSCPTPPIRKCYDVYKETLNFSDNSWKPVFSGGPQEKPKIIFIFPYSRNSLVQAA